MESFRALLPYFPLSIEGQAAVGSIPSMLHGEQPLSPHLAAKGNGVVPLSACTYNRTVSGLTNKISGWDDGKGRYQFLGVRSYSRFGATSPRKSIFTRLRTIAPMNAAPKPRT